jgi:hypothetical protein
MATSTADHGRPQTGPRGRLRTITQPPHRNALIVMTIAITMAGVFAISYSLALGRPAPHHIPAAAIGDPSTRPKLVAALEAATHDGLDLHPYASLARAKHAIDTQQIYAALLLNRGPPRLFVASAAGVSVARLLEQVAMRIPTRAGGPLSVVDLRPLPPSDPQGLVAFYATIAATILGFVTMFQLRANAPGLSLRAWLVCVAILVAAGSLVLALITDPLLGALRGPFAELWAVLAAEVAVAALFNSWMLTLIPRWAIVPTWGLFIAIGNASSGGAVAPPLLPAFYRFVGRFLPNGATVETLRNAVYFQSHQQLEPIIVEGTWLVCSLAGLLLTARLKGRTPSA